MNYRCLMVPLNEEGMEEYEYCVENTNNILEIELPESEYNLLLGGGLFDKFNEKFDLFIGDYECDEIYFNNLNEALIIVSPYENDLSVFVSCLKLAIEKRTLLGINL